MTGKTQGAGGTQSERGESRSQARSLDHIRVGAYRIVVGAYHIVGPVFLFRDILLENYSLRMIYAMW